MGEVMEREWGDAKVHSCGVGKLVPKRSDLHDEHILCVWEQYDECSVECGC